MRRQANNFNEPRYSKNVTLSKGSIEIIEGYQNRTRSNFSDTLDQIIKDWDKISVQLMRIKRVEAEKEAEAKIQELKQAEIVKEVKR
jgi:hypothetical protein